MGISVEEIATILADATGVLGQLSTLVPTIIGNFEQAKTALSSTDAADIAAQIAATHETVKALDAKLQALNAPPA